MRAQIAQAARRMHRVTQGRRIPDEELHLTLAFIGAVSEERLEHLLKPPSEIFPPAFLLTLDDWGLWTRKGIGWTGPSVVPASLRRLAEKLDSWLRAEGFDRERRSTAYVWHIDPLACRRHCADELRGDSTQRPLHCAGQILFALIRLALYRHDGQFNSCFQSTA